jgi:hypothetical protein
MPTEFRRGNILEINHLQDQAGNWNMTLRRNKGDQSVRWIELAHDDVQRLALVLAILKFWVLLLER